ncbi:hypothetical protein [Streptomyces sp. NBC_00690]|uniref:hypothetical protein n=1 Tax=Streptomyces sp. NBC_00690 TaxID=2975808 RepID=UPI002E293063|nr:hypothetical protein [Streptomyces sp. NBC_00690]
MSLLAPGTALAAVGLTLEIAARNEQDPGEFLDSLAKAARDQEGGEFPLAVDVIRGMFFRSLHASDSRRTASQRGADTR